MGKYLWCEKGNARPHRKQNPYHRDTATAWGRHKMTTAFIGVVKNPAPAQDMHKRAAAGEDGDEDGRENGQRDKWNRGQGHELGLYPR